MTMSENPVPSKTVVPSHVLRSGFVLLGCTAALLNGCSMRKRPSFAWNAAILTRPISPPHPTTAADLTEDPVPELQLEPPTFPLQLISTRNGPVRPHVTPAVSNGPGTDPEKLQSPAIAPALSAQETTIDRQQANESLDVAEKNLAASQGKNLNAAQSDMVSKIQSFIKDAREAARLSDWTRARGLAKKAQVLSEELAGSF